MGASRVLHADFHQRQGDFDYGKLKGRSNNQDDDYLEWILKTCKHPRPDARQPAKSNVHDLLVYLKSCSRKRDLEEGRRAHTNAVESGNDSNMYVSASLINMYAKCGSMVDARRVFDAIEKPHVGSWNALILGYAQNGEGYAALDRFSRMKSAGCDPDSVTYLAAIKACTSLAVDGDSSRKKACLERGREIHMEIGCHLTHFVQNKLIDMYAKCCSMLDAQRVFDCVEGADVVSWNTLILGYVENGEGFVALELFDRMKATRRIDPDTVTYLAAMKACTYIAVHGDGSMKEEYLERGRDIHSKIGCDLSHVVQNTLINMYAKCGSMVDAQQVFDSMKQPNVVSWTVLFLGYAENGEGRAALELFSRMNAARGCAPDSVTYVSAVKACTYLAADGDEAEKAECLKQGRGIHSKIGHHMDNFVQSALINMYAKCGSMVDAQRVFDRIEDPDVVCWTTLIVGYADNGEGQAALDLFSWMKTTCAPDSIAYVAALKACGSIGALAIGRKFHSEVADFDVHVVTCLVDFYAKCGSMVEAHKVFDAHMKARHITAWNALITGYSSFGDTASVFNLFKEMQDQGFQPNAVTFLCILSCCSHAGLVEKAREYLKAMPVQYGVIPTVMHYNCMIDILGRANQLDEAVALLQKMPCKCDAVTWMALLGVCRKWKNVEIGKLAFQSLVDLDKKNAAAYLLMSQLYGCRGMWEEQKKVLEIWGKSGAWKLPGQAYVMDGVGNTVKFVVGGKDPPELTDKLNQLLKGMKECSYTESYNVANGEKKEILLCGHSEKRAVVYGILKAPPGEPVRAFKNMKMCDDCHLAITIFSKLSQRVIIVRDDSQFHVMENGKCSCGEYSWAKPSLTRLKPSLTELRSSLSLEK